VFAVQEQIARAITGPLELRFITSNGTPVVSGTTGDPEAHRLYLKGRGLSYSFDGDQRHLAVDYFRKALERDSNYALAWAGLADGYDLLTDALELREIPVVREKARAAALRAIALDSTLAEAHVALGNIQANIDWSWEPAEHNFRQAIALNPNSSSAHRGYSALLTIVGRYPEAVTEAERAEQLDPLSTFMKLGTIWACRTARRYECAVAAARRWVELDPNGYAVLGQMQFLAGRQQEAFANLERAATRASDDPYSVEVLWLAYAYAASGQRAKARTVLNRVQREPGRAWPSSTEFASVYAALGDTNTAFDWLEHAYAAHENEIQMMGAMPELDPLRGDPRFTRLLRRMRIPA
jgi:tetratricopeptide (TPR) repeat protein